jgi:hypothetical protein
MGTPQRYWQWATAALFFLLGMALFNTFGNYGMSWDEHYRQTEGAKKLPTTTSGWQASGNPTTTLRISTRVSLISHTSFSTAQGSLAQGSSGLSSLGIFYLGSLAYSQYWPPTRSAASLAARAQASLRHSFWRSSPTFMGICISIPRIYPLPAVTSGAYIISSVLSSSA